MYIHFITGSQSTTCIWHVHHCTEPYSRQKFL